MYFFPLWSLTKSAHREGVAMAESYLSCFILPKASVALHPDSAGFLVLFFLCLPSAYATRWLF